MTLLLVPPAKTGEIHKMTHPTASPWRIGNSLQDGHPARPSHGRTGMAVLRAVYAKGSIFCNRNSCGILAKPATLPASLCSSAALESSISPRPVGATSHFPRILDFSSSSALQFGRIVGRGAKRGLYLSGFGEPPMASLPLQGEECPSTERRVPT